MAVLTRCEAEWRFYSSPLSPRLAIHVQINSIQPLKMLHTHQANARFLRWIILYYSYVKNMAGVELRLMSLGSVFTPGG